MCQSCPLDVQINADILERFSNAKYHRRYGGGAQDDSYHQMTKYHNLAIQKYIIDAGQAADPQSWLSCPEIPTPEEALDITEPWQRVDPEDNGILLSGNRLCGPWDSKDQYLSAQFEMLREEVIRPLREAIHWVKNNPTLREDQHAFGGNIGIYEKVVLNMLCHTHLSNADIYRCVSLPSPSPIVPWGFELCFLSAELANT
jgi:hypothetical protein